MSTIVEPLKWLKDFSEPKDELELLERALEWAKDEERWVAGALLEGVGHRNGDNQPPLIYMPDDQLCMNVRACAMGVLVLCTYNGPIVRKYILGHENINETALSEDHPILGNAVLHLARGLHVHGRKFRSIREAVRFIENQNDCEANFAKTDVDGEVIYDTYKRAEHHQSIVRGFERAVTYARKAQDKNQVEDGGKS